MFIHISLNRRATLFTWRARRLVDRLIEGINRITIVRILQSPSVYLDSYNILLDLPLVTWVPIQLADTKQQMIIQDVLDVVAKEHMKLFSLIDSYIWTSGR